MSARGVAAKHTLIPRGAIFRALKSKGLIDDIGLSISDAPNIRQEFWSIFFALDGEGQPTALLDIATIIANIEASVYLNCGWELGGNSTKGYFLYPEGTDESILRRAYRWAGEIYPVADYITDVDGAYILDADGASITDI